MFAIGFGYKQLLGLVVSFANKNELKIRNNL
jgi:hypothetical protein